MRIREVDLRRRREVRRFVDLPFRLHGADPLWVPPVLAEQRSELHPRRNPFFRHSEAALLTAERDGRVVGRMAVMHHRRFNDHTGFGGALFGAFACEEDQSAARALFEAAAGWGSARGLDGIAGPRRFVSTPEGILVEGFEHPPALGSPYNPPYYGALVESAGLRKDTDYLSAYLDTSHPVPAQVLEMADAAAATHGYRRVMHRSRWSLWRDRMSMVDLYNRAFAGAGDFCPLTEAERRRMATGMALIADPEVVFRIEAPGGEVAAYMVMLPEISAAIRRSRGRILPLGWLRMHRAARRSDLASIQVFGVAPEHRGNGANLVAYASMKRRAPTSRYRRAEVVMVAEGNGRMRANLDALGGITWAKRHRLYRT